jgi:hypothetical protein
MGLNLMHQAEQKVSPPVDIANRIETKIRRGLRPHS